MSARNLGKLMPPPLDENARFNARLGGFFIKLCLGLSAGMAFAVMLTLDLGSESGRPSPIQALLGIYIGLVLAVAFSLHKVSRFRWHHYLLTALVVVPGALLILTNILIGADILP
jgi:hypothetical protein